MHHKNMPENKVNKKKKKLYRECHGCKKKAKYSCICGLLLCEECSEGGSCCPEDYEDHIVSELKS